MMADPAFFHKLMLETTFAAGSSLYYELHMRGRNLRRDFDQVAISVLGWSLATGLCVYQVAPNRFKFSY